MIHDCDQKRFLFLSKHHNYIVQCQQVFFPLIMKTDITVIYIFVPLTLVTKYNKRSGIERLIHSNTSPPTFLSISFLISSRLEKETGMGLPGLDLGIGDSRRRLKGSWDENGNIRCLFSLLALSCFLWQNFPDLPIVQPSFFSRKKNSWSPIANHTMFPPLPSVARSVSAVLLIHFNSPHNHIHYASFEITLCFVFLI